MAAAESVDGSPSVTLSGIGGDVRLCAHGVTDLADAQFPDFLDSADYGYGCGGLINECWIDRVHQSGADLANCGTQYANNGDRNPEPDEGIAGA